MSSRERSLFVATALVFAMGTSAAREARADVRFAGTWPDQEPAVSVDVTGTRAEALRAIADKAGFGVVMTDVDDQKITMRVADVPPRELLSALLADGRWVATRTGKIVSIERDGAAGGVPSAAVPGAPDGQIDPPAASPPPAPATPVPPPPPSPPPASEPRERDVEVFGDSLRIGKDDVVRNVTVLGGSVEIEGKVTGNLAVLGGDAHLSSGARIEGDASVTGGRIRVDPGAQIEGNLGVVGGSIEGVENAKIGGSVTLDPAEGTDRASFGARAGHRIAEGVRSAALLFLLGVLFIALGGDRSETLRAEIAARTMRSLALGVAGIVGGIAALIAISITIIGIPVAFVGALLAIIAMFAGITSALTVLGAAVARHRTTNVYAHLAVGCGLFLLAGWLPWIGGFLQAGVVLAGIGSVVATRATGLVPRWKKQSGSPYRAEV